ncbi:MAG TPA: aspartate/glutamate racemase family protein [Candidatus Absconditabacterales bacterium]|nr:aspartate/glutamate racemase family protein [Candidatus Absconditabacterales bacterium]
MMGKIGFFDSGFGGLQTMKYFYELYPQYDYMFLADNKNCPFGKKSGDEIQKITFDALNWFFDNGAQIVIVACNTAAAYSIRKRQTLYPNKKTLSITVPGVEEILLSENVGLSIGVIATQATITSDIYNDLYYRFGGNKKPDFHFVMAPTLVDMVESGATEDKIIEEIKMYLAKFPKNLQILVLGCTHFSVYKDYFAQLFSGKIIDPSFNSAIKFSDYLNKHSEIESQIGKTGKIDYYVVGDKNKFDEIGSKIWGKNISSQSIII